MPEYYKFPILAAFIIVISAPNIYSIHYASFTSEPKCITMPGNLPGLEIKFKVGEFHCFLEEPWLSKSREGIWCEPPPVIVFLAVDLE